MAHMSNVKKIVIHLEYMKYESIAVQIIKEKIEFLKFSKPCGADYISIQFLNRHISFQLCQIPHPTKSNNPIVSLKFQTTLMSKKCCKLWLKQPKGTFLEVLDTH